MRSYLDLVVPVKRLERAKSRLVGAADGGIGDQRAHADLVVALALDTITAAAGADGVGDVVVVTSDPMLTAVLRAEGIRCVPEAEPGLNEAYRHGASMLGRHVGALQADLPALRSAELAAAIAAADGKRAFVPDRQGTGTTLLISAPGEPLDPRFGVGSAQAHRASGAVELIGDWPSLRCDVDTEADLSIAAGLGLGPRTAQRFRLSA
ncbi:2-phospho-L-lactate guanylyltransferase [Kutzneria sp. CA-103260]|uniref:2-phospho-L-lactate guanylyltransferase n=1 Tax=Kutzneria sp. CA-103260 TaxID=2802641 RepID=UPI001BEEB47D|nr:2-phospho-L-lactate guanylyltransferase [Kutzneria sp. CA-103260]QUQ71412.1 2-phospho-L-lactate guanylyltransferase [Kutzneria sp. CA-103260]